MSAAIRVVVYRVGKPPVVEEIDPDDLGVLQALVGGYLEHVELPAGLHLWCNEDGARGQPLNRLVRARPVPPAKLRSQGGAYDFIVFLGGKKPGEVEGDYHRVYGTFFLSRTRGTELASVTDADLKRLGINDKEKPQ